MKPADPRRVETDTHPCEAAPPVATALDECAGCTPDPPEQAERPRRREFLKPLAAAVAMLAAAPFLGKAKAATRELESAASSGKRARWGMVIDLDRCSSCQACVVACREENNVPFATQDDAEVDRGIFWMDALKEGEDHYPEMKGMVLPTPCNHCDNAPCIKVCPVGATYISDEGIVAQIWARCIGCRYCTVACPYTRRYFNWNAPDFSAEARQHLNPDVATRPRGVVEKCTFCHHRIRTARHAAQAEGRPLEDTDVQRLPACAESCPTDAITFGDLNDPDSSVTRLSHDSRAFRLQEELGTHPKVSYLRRRS